MKKLIYCLGLIGVIGANSAWAQNAARRTMQIAPVGHINRGGSTEIPAFIPPASLSTQATSTLCTPEQRVTYVQGFPVCEADPLRNSIMAATADCGADRFPIYTGNNPDGSMAWTCQDKLRNDVVTAQNTATAAQNTANTAVAFNTRLNQSSNACPEGTTVGRIKADGTVECVQGGSNGGGDLPPECQCAEGKKLSNEVDCRLGIAPAACVDPKCADAMLAAQNMGSGCHLVPECEGPNGAIRNEVKTTTPAIYTTETMNNALLKGEGDTATYKYPIFLADMRQEANLKSVKDFICGSNAISLKLDPTDTKMTSVRFHLKRVDANNNNGNCKNRVDDEADYTFNSAGTGTHQNGDRANVVKVAPYTMTGLSSTGREVKTIVTVTGDGGRQEKCTTIRGMSVYFAVNAVCSYAASNCATPPPADPCESFKNDVGHYYCCKSGGNYKPTGGGGGSCDMGNQR